MRKKIIAANWKMNKDINETMEFFTALQKELNGYNGTVEIVVCPPFTALQTAVKAAQGTQFKIGAQNLHYENDGAFTGEISARMIKSLGVPYVIIGHSERRQYFGEADETVAKKVKKALSEGLRVILCVGETLSERDGNITEKVLERQVRVALNSLTPEQLKSIVIAYEPVWAIGTGRNATPQQAQEAHAFIREVVSKMLGNSSAQDLTIQYGGSMKPENSGELLSQPDVDGGLIGGAGLKADSFAKIVKSAPAAK